MFKNLFGGASKSPDLDFPTFAKAVAAGEVTVVDVREPHEFAAGHIPDAVNLPLSRIRPERTSERKGQARRHPVPSGRALAQGARRGPGGRPRRPEALSGRHERVAHAWRRRVGLKRPRTTTKAAPKRRHSAASRMAPMRASWARSGAGFSGLCRMTMSWRAASSRASTLRSAVARIAGIARPRSWRSAPIAAMPSPLSR